MADRVAYSRVPTRAAADGKISRGGLRLLIALGRFINAATGRAHPGLARLAKEMGTSKRRVVELIGELEAGGYISRRQRHTSDGDRDTNEYEMNFAEVVSTGGTTPVVSTGGTTKRAKKAPPWGGQGAPQVVQPGGPESIPREVTQLRNPASNDAIGKSWADDEPQRSNTETLTRRMPSRNEHRLQWGETIDRIERVTSMPRNKITDLLMGESEDSELLDRRTPDSRVAEIVGDLGSVREATKQ